MYGDWFLKKTERAIENNRPVRINIHLELSDEVRTSVYNLNRTMNKDIRHVIEYGRHSIIKPHISLLQGDIVNFSKCDKVISSLEKVIKNYNQPINVEFDKFVPSANKTWLFLYLKDNATINNLIKDLTTELKGTMMNLKYLGTPHISITKSDYLEENLKYVDDLVVPEGFVANRLVISLGGNCGTVLKDIKIYNLSN